MAKKKISDLPAGSALTGIELVPIVQSGTTKRITAQDIADLSNASSIGGGGTANYVSKFTTEFNIGDSQIFDNGTSVGIATDTPNASYKLDVNGSLQATSIVKSGGTSAQFLKADGSVDSSTYQTAITLTTIGTSGAATLVGSTLNIPNYADTDTGITSLNGLTALTQTFAVGTSGTDFGISSATSTHTFNLPTASATNRGALSSADWTTFNAKIGGSGTTNYLPKFTGSSALGNSLVYDNGTNVGIGTTSPSTKLHILSYNSSSTLSTSNTASLVIQNTYGSAGQTGGALFFKSDTGTNNTFAGIGGDLLGSTSSGSYGHLIFGTKNTATDTSLFERMRITSDGNVGIGTTAPAYKLDINGGVHISSGNYYRYATDVGIIGSGTSITGGLATQLGIRSSSDILFSTGGATERMRINSVGNLGLGITPSTATGRFIQFGAGAALSTNNTNNSNFWHNTTFDASGNTLYAVTGQQSSYYRQINGLHAWATAPSGTAGNAITFTTNMVLDASGRLGIGTTSPSYKFQTASSVNSDWVGSFYNTSTTNPNGLQVRVGVSSSSQALGVYTDGVGYTFSVLGNGNTLIGTTTDSGHKLNVNGTAKISNELRVQTNASAISLNSNDAYGSFIGFYTTGPTTGYIGNAYHLFGSPYNANTDLGIRSQGNLILSSGGGTHFLTLSSSTGAATFSSSVTATQATLKANNVFNQDGDGQISIRGASNPEKTLLIGFDTTSNYSYLQSIWQGNSSKPLVLQPWGGSVCIGTTTPVHALSVVGKIGGNIFGDSYVEFTSTGHTLLKANNDVFLGYSQNFVVKQNGNTLIGTTTDAGYKLDVNGTARVNGLITSNRTSNTDGGIIFGNPSLGKYIYGADSGGYIATYTDNTERMRITSLGSVGINTTTPDASALVQIDSNTQGFLVPRMGEGEINSISSPAAGLMVYNTDINHMCMFDGSIWKKFSMSNM